MKSLFDVGGLNVRVYVTVCDCQCVCVCRCLSMFQTEHVPVGLSVCLSGVCINIAANREVGGFYLYCASGMALTLWPTVPIVSISIHVYVLRRFAEP